MSIIRAPRPQSNFYLLDKKISEDHRLSWAARGVLIFLLGKPDHWVVSTQHLINETASSAKPLGRDAVRGLLAELIGAGYLRRVLSRNDGGKLGGYDYEVSEQWVTPETEKPGPVQPATDLPGPAEPAPADPPLVSTDQKQGLSSSKSPQTPKGGTQGSADAEKKPRSTPAVGINTWLAAVKAKGEKPIPDSDPIFEWADTVGLPHEFLGLAWKEFKRRSANSGKRQSDWRRTFRNCVEGNWYHFWWLNGETYQLTSNGATAKKFHEKEAA